MFDKFIENFDKFIENFHEWFLVVVSGQYHGKNNYAQN